MMPKLVGVIENCIWVYQGCIGWGHEWNIGHGVQGCATCKYPWCVNTCLPPFTLSADRNQVENFPTLMSLHPHCCRKL